MTNWKNSFDRKALLSYINSRKFCGTNCVEMVVHIAIIVNVTWLTQDNNKYFGFQDIGNAISVVDKKQLYYLIATLDAYRGQQRFTKKHEIAWNLFENILNGINRLGYYPKPAEVAVLEKCLEAAHYWRLRINENSPLTIYIVGQFKRTNWVKYHLTFVSIYLTIFGYEYLSMLKGKITIDAAMNVVYCMYNYCTYVCVDYL